MKSDSEVKQQSKKLLSHILKLSNDIFLVMKINIPSEWLTSDMTVAQLRVLLLLQADGPSRMSDIAASIGTTLPTITGTVNHLVKKELVTRRDDPEDRRIVICELSLMGKDVMNRMWKLGQLQMERLLSGLSLDELKKADEVAEILLRNVTSHKVQTG